MVILIRHAEAGDAAQDELRPLTARGRAESTRLGRFLGRSGALAGAAIWHSTLQRARETAELVSAAHGGLTAALREVPGFAPEDDPRLAAARLAEQDGTVAVFGHNPHLTALATMLLKGEGASAPVVVFEKGAALALEKFGSGRPGQWSLCWHLSPVLLRERR